jgi:hypothetical protein
VAPHTEDHCKSRQPGIRSIDHALRVTAEILLSNVNLYLGPHHTVGPTAPCTIGWSNAPFLSLTAGSLKSYSGIQLRLRQRRLGHHPRPFCWPGCGQHVAQTCPPPSAPRRRGCVPTSHPVSLHPVSRGLHAVTIDGGELEETFMGLSARCAHLFSESRLTRRDTGT